jgi:hypothetical protein
MNQLSTIETILTWLRTIVDAPRTVRCDHVTEQREELALFPGDKLAGTGRGSRIAQVDLIVCNESDRTVNLVVEVDPNPNPKKALGDVFAVLLADNYTPSNGFSPFRIDGTVFVYLTVLPQKPGSQKGEQFRIIEGAIQRKVDLHGLGIRAVHLCHGATEGEAIERFRQVVEPYFKP